jgi:hypothetical protein
MIMKKMGVAMKVKTRKKISTQPGMNRLEVQANRRNGRIGRIGMAKKSMINGHRKTKHTSKEQRRSLVFIM